MKTYNIQITLDCPNAHEPSNDDIAELIERSIWSFCGMIRENAQFFGTQAEANLIEDVTQEFRQP